MTTIIDPLCCGFAKVAMFELRKDYSSDVNKSSSVTDLSVSLDLQFQHFNREFNFDLTYEWYRRNVPKIREMVQTLGKNNKDMKTKILDCFPLTNWAKESKKKHNLFDCKECLRSDKLRPILSLFPIKNKDRKALKRASEGGFFRPPIESEVTATVAKLNDQFSESYGKTF